MSRLNAGLESSQMPYPVAISFQFLFRKLGYRFVKLTEYRGFVIRQRSCNRYRIGDMMSEQIDRDIQSATSVRISTRRSISGSSMYVPSNTS